jgi:hypothetical protein
MDGFIVVMASLSPVTTMLVAFIMASINVRGTSAFKQKANQQLNIARVIRGVSNSLIEPYAFCVMLSSLK